jgi:hypothetical protein
MASKNTSTLPPGYCRNRPIFHISANAMASLTHLEIAWVISEWASFTGGPEDQPYNVIMERTSPQMEIRVWVCDRDGEDSLPILMLPED